MKLSMPLCAAAFAFAWLLPPAVAAPADRNWVQSGSQGALKECVDQNSVVKRPDGYTQYDELTFCQARDIAHEVDPRPNLTDMIRVNRVRCDQDMSGENILMKGVPYSPPQHWGEEVATLTKSLAGQTAKFVCQK